MARPNNLSVIENNAPTAETNLADLKNTLKDHGKKLKSTVTLINVVLIVCVLGFLGFLYSYFTYNAEAYKQYTNAINGLKNEKMTELENRVGTLEKLGSQKHLHH